jgi:hypothetical protein
MSGWTIYLITRMDSIRATLLGMLVVCTVVTLVSFIVMVSSYNGYDDKIYDLTRSFLVKYCVPIVIVISVLLRVLPSTKELAAIYIVPRLVNNEQIQQIPNNAAILINEQLKSWMKDILPGESDLPDSTISE